MTTIPPEFDGINTGDYDPQYTADISNKMRIPETIGPVSSGDKVNDMFDDMHRSANMMVPDKIIVVGQEQSRGMRADPNLHLDATAFHSLDIPVSLNTPPRILKLNEVSFLDHTGDKRKTHPSGGDTFLLNEDSLTHNGLVQTTPHRQTDDSLHRQALLATPGEHLLISDEEEDEFTKMRKHVAKLSYHVVKLQEENTSRRQREFVLYPLMFGYLFIQMMKWFMKTK